MIKNIMIELIRKMLREAIESLSSINNEEKHPSPILVIMRGVP
jgi:hypothetical protein